MSKSSSRKKQDRARAAAKRAEQERLRTERFGPRTLDLDILLYGDQVIREEQLTIPHPRLHERNFMLGPLAEIAPQAVHPVFHRTITQLLAELGHRPLLGKRALVTGASSGVGKAIAGAFEVSVKSAYRVGRFTVVPEFGLQWGKTFILLRISFAQDLGVVVIENVPFQVKAALKLALNIGLSKKGWEEVRKRVGPQALRSYLAKGGRALGAVGEWLVTDGVLVTAGAAGVAGTFGLLALRSWVVGKSIQKATLQALGTWYLSAYVATVFNGQMPFGSTTGWPQDQIRLRNDLVARAPRDAVADARAALLVAGERAARGSDSDALSAWRMALTAQQNGRADRAQAQLRQDLEPRVRGIMGY